MASYEEDDALLCQIVVAMVSATADFRPDCLRRVEECQDKDVGRELWLFIQSITTMKTKPQQEKLCAGASGREWRGDDLVGENINIQKPMLSH